MKGEDRMSGKAKGRGLRLLAALLCLGLASGGFMIVRGNRRAVAEESPAVTEAAAAKVTVAVVRRAERLSQGFQSASTLEALEEVTLLPKVTGRLVGLRARQGDRVARGDVVAVLDHRDQDAQIAALKAQIAVAEAESAQAKVTLDDALRERDRYRKLLAEGFATQQELDSRETTYQSAQAAYRKTQASVAQQRANLKTQEVQRSEYILTAPIDGTILDDYSLTEGTMVSTSTAVAKIGKIAVLKAVLQVPETRGGRLKEGMKALLSGDSFSGVAGKILRIRPYVDTSTRTVQVEVAVDNGAGRLKPGMFATVFLVEAEVDGALTLPVEALRSGSVFVVDDGRIAVRPVETGIEASGLVEIREGLSEGDLVVVTGASSLKEGDAVRYDPPAAN